LEPAVQSVNVIADSVVTKNLAQSISCYGGL